MEIINSFHSGLRNGINNNGYVVYCRYGLAHLICLPINNLHPVLNSEDVVSGLYQYAMQSPVALSDYSQSELIECLSLLVAHSKLLIIPLFD